TTLMRLGAVALAHTHFTQGIALYDPQQHRTSVFLYGEDAGVICLSRDVLALWFLGYPDQAFVRSHEARTLAQQVAHPYSLVYALSLAARFHQLRREAHGMQECAEALLSLAQRHGFAHLLAYGTCYQGWALAQQGHAREGIVQITQGLGAYRATGAEVARASFLALLAEAHGTLGEPESGLAVLAEALTLAETTGDCWYAPELYLLQGELLQQHAANQAEAETCFNHALAVARNQQAKSLELQVATSLARLWQQQGKRQEAHDLLAPVYGWFTEGFDTTDLQEAKALLEELVG